MELLEKMTCMLMEKHGEQISLKVEAGNKLLTIIILENNIAVKVMYMTLQKINFYHHNLLHLGH